MSETAGLVREMETLRAAVAAHKALLRKANEVLAEAEDFSAVPTDKYGRYVVDLSKEAWRYPVLEAALREVDRLDDDNGYFWACSRLEDLERMLGAGWSTQLPLRYPTDPMGNYVPFYGGHIPAANESVSEFVARYA